MTIEDVIKNSEIDDKEKERLLKEFETINSIAKTVQLTSKLASELVKVIKGHLEELYNDNTLYNRFSMYEQSVLSVITTVIPHHGHID